MNWRQLGLMVVVIGLAASANAQFGRGDSRGGAGRGGDWGRGHDRGRGPVRARACFYEHINFGGASFCMNDGEQNQNLVSSGWNDRISSVLIEGAVDVTVYQDIVYGGRAVRLTRTETDLRSQGLNDTISSISTGFQRPLPRPQPPLPRLGRACFYEHVNYAGASFCLNEGEQNVNLVPSGWNDRISSILVEGRITVIVYRDIHMGGVSATLTTSLPNINGGNWNDQISSINILNAQGLPPRR